MKWEKISYVEYIDLVEAPALHRCAKHCGQVKPLLQFEILSARFPNRRRGALPVIRKSEVVEKYFPFIR